MPSTTSSPPTTTATAGSRKTGSATAAGATAPAAVFASGPRRWGSAPLLDPHHAAGRVTEGAVPHAVRLVGGLLDDVGAAGLQLLEGAVHIGGGQQDVGVGALGHHLGDGAALVVGHARLGPGRVEDDGRAQLRGGSDRDPPHPVVTDVVADLEAEDVAIEGQRCVGVVVREEGRVDGDVHVRDAKTGSVIALLDS